MTNIQIWVGNLGKYNEGELVGDWFTLPHSIEDIYVQIGLGQYDKDGNYTHGVAEGDSFYEEWYIGDYEAPFSIGEYASITKLNEIAEAMDGMNEDDVTAVSALVENGIADNFIDGIEKLDEVVYYHDCNNMSDVAYDWIHNHVGSVEDAVSKDRIGYYIDADAIKRDLDIDCYFDDMEEDQGEELSDDEKEEHVHSMIEEGLFSGESYFDYEAFGRDMEIEGTFITLDNDTIIQYMD